MYAGDEGGEDEEARRVRTEEREGRRGGRDEPFLWFILVKFGSRVLVQVRIFPVPFFR